MVEETGGPSNLKMMWKKVYLICVSWKVVSSVRSNISFSNIFPKDAFIRKMT